MPQRLLGSPARGDVSHHRAAFLLIRGGHGRDLHKYRRPVISYQGHLQVCLASAAKTWRRKSLNTG